MTSPADRLTRLTPSTKTRRPGMESRVEDDSGPRDTKAQGRRSVPLNAPEAPGVHRPVLSCHGDQDLSARRADRPRGKPSTAPDGGPCPDVGRTCPLRCGRHRHEVPPACRPGPGSLTYRTAPWRHSRSLDEPCPGDGRSDVKAREPASTRGLRDGASGRPRGAAHDGRHGKAT